MNAYFAQVSFHWNNKLKVDEVVDAFNKAVDWARIAPNCWIIYTTSPAKVWYNRIKPHLDEGDHVFICRLDMTERQGWLPKWTWEWMNKKR
jgi:hypothetical protein